VATNDLDIIVANESSDNITYAAGDAELGFNSANYPTGDGPSGVTTTDANNDSLADVLTSNLNGGNISVLLAQPNPNQNNNSPVPPLFAAPVNYPAGPIPSDIAVRQLDGAGRQDVVVPNECALSGCPSSTSAGTVSVLLASSTGGYAPPVAYRVGSGPTAVALGDVNNDGKIDIVTANSGSNSVSLLQGNGNGTFGTARSFRAHTRPSDVAIFDMNLDGAQDLVVTNAGSGDVSVLLQSPAAIASCHDAIYRGKLIVSCGLRVAGYSRAVRASGRATSFNGRVRYASSTMTINQRPNRTSTMRLISRGTLPQAVTVAVSFSIPGSTRRVTQSVVAKR
jgi:hypothetical protein